MSKKERVSLFFMPTLIDPQALILPNITSDKDYIKNKYDSCLRNMKGRISCWYDEEIKYPIYCSPKVKMINVNKFRRDEVIDKIKEETLPVIGKRFLSIDTEEKKKETMTKREFTENNANTIDVSDSSKAGINIQNLNNFSDVNGYYKARKGVNFKNEKIQHFVKKEKYQISRNKRLNNVNSYTMLNNSYGNVNVLNSVNPQAQLIDLRFFVSKSNKKYNQAEIKTNS